MTASYRLVHYVPDPFAEAQFALGAVVSVGQDVRGAPATHLPGPDCLGGAAHARLALLLSRQLGDIDSIAQIERLFGPQVQLSRPYTLPAGVADPVTWVQAHVLPRPIAAQTLSRGHTLPYQGYQFFETWGVQRHVRKTFRADTDGSAWLGGRGRGLQPITHWVQGPDGLLLMEPVSPLRPKLHDDLQTLATRLLAWRSVLTPPKGPPVAGRLVAYVLTGGRAFDRASVADMLGDKADLVVDTDDADARSAFLAEVQRLGEAGARQAQITH